MIKYLTPFILCSVTLISACGNASNSANDTKTSQENVVQHVSAEDQKIIDKYESYFKYYREGNFEEFQKKMKEVLPEVSKITNKSKREFMQMNIYMTLQNYDEAYALNEKQLSEKPNDLARLNFRCQLHTLQNKSSDVVSKCYDITAKALKAELEKPESKKDPNYKQAEFTYLLTMYKAGHPEYKEKMQKFIEEIDDEALKTSLRTVYDSEVVK
ncbi:hypothetical protein [Acinetobacter baumannii]|uniref:hypothetical protein n=1 Tax=Acinetobacter baumannii TaxID=470 RepID=UPI00164E603C|nr:hypothetical protein [Acinetobacter baumannii]QMS81784.1 hypothetical protein GWK28_07385 [Acinetobacter baumannii]